VEYTIYVEYLVIDILQLLIRNSNRKLSNSVLYWKPLIVTVDYVIWQIWKQNQCHIDGDFQTKRYFRELKLIDNSIVWF